MHATVHTSTYTYKHACMHAPARTHTPTHTHICTHTHTRLCFRASLTHTHTHTHTHRHTQTQMRTHTINILKKKSLYPPPHIQSLLSYLHIYTARTAATLWWGICKVAGILIFLHNHHICINSDRDFLIISSCIISIPQQNILI